MEGKACETSSITCEWNKFEVLKIRFGQSQRQNSNSTQNRENKNTENIWYTDDTSILNFMSLKYC